MYKNEILKTYVHEETLRVGTKGKSKTKKVGLVRFELTIDGYLRTSAYSLVLVSIFQCSNGSSTTSPSGETQ